MMDEDMDRVAARQAGQVRQLAPRIESDAEILHGKPVIAGTRISVEVLLEHLAAGDSFAEVLEDYPFLTQADLVAALEYAAFLAGGSPPERERTAS